MNHAGEEPLGSAGPRWVKVLDQNRCIGCHACTTACKSENSVPLGVSRTYVKSVEVGRYPTVRRAFQVNRCNQCSDAPCVTACPTRAMFQRADGIVDFDKSVCIGCKACMAACPYDAIFINPDDHSAEKCNFCAHRLEVGLEPACVTVCPTGAILVGDVHDPSSKVALIVGRQPVDVRRPEKETRPGVFYKGAHHSTLDPLAARRPEGRLYAWSNQLDGHDTVVSGHPAAHNGTPEAVVCYDVPHQIPWGWRVSLYTTTKAVATGVLAVTIVLGYFGKLSFASSTVRLGAPSVAVAFLGITGLLLIWDLKHPSRFYLIFTRHHWSSWLVRGSLLLALYGLVASLFLLFGILGRLEVLSRSNCSHLLRAVGVFCLIGSAGAACYTAFLFAQAKARDLWQSPLLVPHMAVQAAAAGAAGLLPFAYAFEGSKAQTALEITLAVSSGCYVVFAIGEIALPHSTAHSHLAARAMWRGPYTVYFWLGLAMIATTSAAPWIGVAATPLCLAGLASYEHAYVQGGQSVPLS